MSAVGETIDGDEVEFESASVMRLQPGDVLVFRTAQRLSAEQCDRIGNTIEGLFPGHTCFVIEGGAELMAIRNG